LKRTPARALGRSVAPTSDTTRVRAGALVAAAAALGAGAGLAVSAWSGSAAPERALASPHVRAKIACAACHADRGAERPAAATCTPCHVTTLHASTRAPHRALVAKGALSCATCHPAHAGFQGVTFAARGGERWGAGATLPVARDAATPAGQTVPLVALAACTRCHAVGDPRDPTARCLPPVSARGPSWAVTPSLCFDEHAVVTDAPRASAGKCGAQHGDAHLAAVELAGDVARTTAWQAEAPNRRGLLWPPALAGLFALIALGVASRRAPVRPTAPSKLPSVEARRKLPRIDASTCLGCNACVEACPFEVLELDSYVARVARPEECCGVVLCEQVCPNGSLTVGEGDLIEGRVEIDERLQSAAVPGVYLAGDLTGVPLIKNAIAQGDRVARAVHEDLRKAPRARARVDADLVIVGGGPAGLAAALRAKELGLACVVLEQGSVAASVRSFPRGKLVHDPPLTLPVEGDLWLAEATKEELVAQWERIVRVRGLEVREGHRVRAASRDEDGVFCVEVEVDGQALTLRARRVLLAIGRRGTPRTLPLELGAGVLEKIHYSLADAASFAQARVVVVGLGDSAMEAALALSRQPGARVTVVARAMSFTRGRARTVAELRRALESRRIDVHFGTRLVAVGRTSATLEDLASGKRESLGNDAVFVMIGGLPSWDLLERVGVVPRREPPPSERHGEAERADGADPETPPR